MTKDSFSKDGIMPPEGAEVVRKALAFTLENVRNAHFDLTETYTNQFVPSP
jgi:NitT/TauT family transport system substrate-binding protein